MMIPRTVVAFMLSLMLAGLAWAVPPVEPLDRALDRADLVVVGKLGKLTPIEGTHQATGEIPVIQVLKGAADLKTVTLQTVAPGQQVVGPVFRHEGDEGIWILNKRAAAGGQARYVAIGPSNLQPQAALDEVKRILKEQGTLTQPPASRPSTAPAAGAAEKIEPHKPHRYVSGKWEYNYGELKFWRGGGPNPSHWGGKLTYDGQPLQPEVKWGVRERDCVRTPWGWLVWCNTGKSGHGAGWEVMDGEPAADRVLPDPAAAQRDLRKQVEALAAQLSSDDFAVRDAATKKLIELGKEVVPILEGLALTDAEAKARVAEVKRAFEPVPAAAVDQQRAAQEEAERRLRDLQRAKDQQRREELMRQQQQ